MTSGVGVGPWGKNVNKGWFWQYFQYLIVMNMVIPFFFFLLSFSFYVTYLVLNSTACDSC